MSGIISVHTSCPQCGEAKTFLLDSVAHEEWRNGKVIQRAFPEIPADDRERLITGYCPSCWEDLFGEDE